MTRLGFTPGKGNPGISVNDTATGTRRELWVNDVTAFFLEYRYQSVSPLFAHQFRGDFIRLTTAPREEAVALRTEAKPKIARLGKLRENVKRVGNTIFIDDIPICLKGEASSSEAASAEMLFSYLQMPIDQREIAATMSAESSGEGPFHALRTSLVKLAPPRMFRSAVLREFDPRDGWKRRLNDYNWHARVADVPLLDSDRSLEPDVTLQKMDLETLKRSLRRDHSITAFRRSVIDYVGRGIPILWGVQLGIVPEKGIPLSYYVQSEEIINPDLALNTIGHGRFLASKESASRAVAPSKPWVGKHMRLIVGYDADSREIIYTDPWGEYHTGKRMPIDDANAITLSLYVVQPKF